MPAPGPTSDRVRESLFGALESADALRGAAVLDLYAGSGALGLEAASRGAASVDLVEKSSRAAAVAERNAAKVAKSVGRDAAILVHRSPVSAFLGGPRGSYDLVFIDPPYDLVEGELTDALALLVPSLAADGDGGRRARRALAAAVAARAGSSTHAKRSTATPCCGGCASPPSSGYPPCASQSR